MAFIINLLQETLAESSEFHNLHSAIKPNLIPHQLKTKKEYYHLNQELENYFANTIIPQLFVDGEMILRKFTPPAMTQFSFTKDDVDRDFNQVKDNIKYPTIIENIEEVIKTGEILEKEIQTTDYKWYQMNILPYIIKKENRTNGVVITFVNITQRVSALRELEKLHARNDTLLYALAHDIRQPLSTILLLKGGLKQSFTENNKELFDKFTNQLTGTVTSITSLLTNFLTENEGEPDYEAEKMRVNIQQIFEEVKASFKNEIYSNNIIITTDFQTTEIKFPRSNLRSIVYNLFSNAVKYSDKDRPLSIDFSTELTDNYVVLKVTDTGRGIPEKHQERIFGKTERLQTDVEGTGMGLYIIKRMLENNNGKVAVESKQGEGSVFSVFFKVD